jgi:MGT family glycosyltransferase
MSTISFLNISMHGRVNPTLPLVAELARRGHTVSYHTAPAFADQIRAAGATVHHYDGPDHPLPDPPTPFGLVAGLATMAVNFLPGVIRDLREIEPDLIVHDSACLWGAVAARELDVPAVSSFTTFAFGLDVPSPTQAPRALGAAFSSPGALRDLLKARWALRHYDVHGIPVVDLGNLRQPLNLVFTSPEFQPHADLFDRSYRFVGPSIGARPDDATFAVEELHDPVLYLSLGTVFGADPRVLRHLALELATFSGSVVVSTGQTDPEQLGTLPGNVVARRTVPQLEVLSRAAVFVTHGGMNSANEALFNGVPMVVIPQGADQPLVAARVAGLDAGIAISPADLADGVVRAAARSVLTQDRFRAAAAELCTAQRRAGGYLRAADEVERLLQAVV